MSDLDPRLAVFLSELERALEAKGVDAAPVVAEAREHLLDGIREAAWRGASPDEAARIALERFGSVEQVVEAWARRSRPRGPSDSPNGKLWSDLGGDVRYALRKIKASPGFAGATLLILAVAMGATTALFSLVSGVLLRPLPFGEPDRLMHVGLRNAWGGEGLYTASVADFVSVKAETKTFDEVAALYIRASTQLSGGDEPLRVRAGSATAGFFSVLGVRPAMGRLFAHDEDAPGREPVTLVSDRLFRTYLQSNPAALGSQVRIDGRPHTVVGVLPPEFRWRGAAVDVWPILSLDPPQAHSPFYLTVVGRRKAGQTESQVRADLSRIEAAIKARYPDSPPDWTFGFQSLRDYQVGRSRPAILLLFGAAALLLTIACANVFNLFLARALSLKQEMATRTALGASPYRLVRQLLVESALLVSAAGALGILLATWGVGPLVAWGADTLALSRDVRVDYRVLGFAATLVALVTAAVGVLPALRETRRPAVQSLKDVTLGASRGARRFYATFAGVEIALATILLVGAGLVAKSLVGLTRVPMGVGAELSSVLTLPIALPEPTYPEDSDVVRFWQALLDRVRALPGVRSAACTMALPPDQLVMTNPFSIEGRPATPGLSPPQAEELLVSPGYFEALGIPIREGRDLGAMDIPGSTAALVVNDELARKHFPGESPLGRRVQLGAPRPDGAWYTIVGVVGDVKYAGLDQEPAPTVYVSYFQESWWREMYLVVRSATDARALTALVRAEASSLDRTLAWGEAKTLSQVSAESVAAPRFRTRLLTAFAGLALTVAALGVYGVLAHAVTRRTREIAIRRAMGATNRQIVALVLNEGLRVIGLGAAAGILGAVAASRLAESLLFEVSPADPATLLGAPAVLSIVGAAACFRPVRRALGIDPGVALKTE